MVKTARTWVAALATCALMQPTAAWAQNGADLFFGIAGAIIEQSIKQEQQQVYQRQQDAVEAERIRAQQQAELAFYRRAQTALAELGFYRLKIDGQVGPGTRAAIAAYQRAFEIAGPFDAQDLPALEILAAQGWRSAAEERAAAVGGFSEREQYLQATRAGFDMRSDWEFAQLQGISDAVEYRRFITSGFGEYSVYVDAKKAGFADRNEYDAALAAGFHDADAFQRFKDSGLPDKAAYEQQKQAKAAAEKGAQDCIEASKAQIWIEAVGSCYAASVAAPGDFEITGLLDTASEQLENKVLADETLLDDKRSELAELISGVSADSEADATARLRGEIYSIEKRVFLANLNLQVVRCSESVDHALWAEAQQSCFADLDIGQLSGEARAKAENLLAELTGKHEIAGDKLEAHQQSIRQEAARLALEEAKAQARALMSEIDAYSLSDGQFIDGLAVARSLLILRV